MHACEGEKNVAELTKKKRNEIKITPKDHFPIYIVWRLQVEEEGE